MENKLTHIEVGIEGRIEAAMHNEIEALTDEELVLVFGSNLSFGGKRLEEICSQMACDEMVKRRPGLFATVIGRRCRRTTKETP